MTYHFYSGQKLEHTAIGFANPGVDNNPVLVAMEANTAYASVQRRSHVPLATGNDYRGNSLLDLGSLPPPPYDYKETPLSHTTRAEPIYEKTYYENEDEMIELRAQHTSVMEKLQNSEAEDGNYLRLVWIATNVFINKLMVSICVHVGVLNGNFLGRSCTVKCC